MSKAKLAAVINTEKAQEALDLIIQFGGDLSNVIDCDESNETDIQFHLTEIAKVCAVAGIEFKEICVEPDKIRPMHL
jgi:hypothetical protein